ncbi:aldo/keto reductase [Ktedonosporobacter rubrisoli]|uniref:Aldo/keto reductase n=1 Tax=Ktedonosporobacter rubrisoli TaxID=2509675 RepID=A0A4V0YY74_KTERU|nr:aldo/keto reductase [Ktedonosporobacter rubrisoli]QBD75231.1 aldo/keto reductase [Ktedonosporobacter rubrisoli]
MRYKLLGKSGLRVSELCLGAMTFGETWGWGASKEECRKIFETFVGAGGNFFDTANIYTGGESEEILGELIAAERERYVIATKYTCSRGSGDPNAGGNQRKNIVQSLEASLKRLGTEYIDLYMVHAWDFLTPVEEVMRALDDQVRAGKILYLGITDVPAWVVAQANTLVERYGWSPFVALSLQYNLIERTSERELLPMAEALGLGVTAWSPLAAGILSGKYSGTASTSAETGRLHAINMTEAWLTERNQTIARAVQQMAGEIGCSPAQLALAWIRAQSPSLIPIVSARKNSQLQDNLACLDITLSAEQLKRLDEVSRIELGFPLDFLATAQSLVYGNTFDSIDSERRNILLKAGAKQ